MCVRVTEPSVLRGALCGHNDAVWGLVYSSAHQRLLSCSADGTVRLWNAADTTPALAIFNEDTGNDHSRIQDMSLRALHINTLILITPQCVLWLRNTSLKYSLCGIHSCSINNTFVMYLQKKHLLLMMSQ